MHTRVALLTGRFMANSDFVTLAVPPFLFEARFNDYVLLPQNFRLCKDPKHGHFDRLDRRTGNVLPYPGVDTEAVGETVTEASEAPKMYGGRTDLPMQYYPVMPPSLYPGYAAPPPFAEDVTPELAPIPEETEEEGETAKPEKEEAEEAGGGGGDVDPPPEAVVTPDTSFESAGEVQSDLVSPSDAETPEHFSRQKRAPQTRLRGCLFKVTLGVHKTEATTALKLADHVADPGVAELGKMDDLLRAINSALEKCCSELFGAAGARDSAGVVLPHLSEFFEPSPQAQPPYKRVSVVLGPRVWMAFSDDRIWQLLGFDTWNVTKTSSLRRHPRKKWLHLSNLYQSSFRRFINRYERDYKALLSTFVADDDAEFRQLLLSDTAITVTVGVTRPESQLTFNLSDARLVEPLAEPADSKVPPALAFSFLENMIGAGLLTLPGGLSGETDLVQKIDRTKYPSLAIPASPVDFISPGIVYVTVAATVEAAQKFGFNPLLFPLHLDPAVAYSSQGVACFIAPPDDLNLTDKQKAFYKSPANEGKLAEDIEAATVLLMAGHLDPVNGFRGVEYGFKRGLAINDMATYIATSSFGKTYYMPESPYYKPYIMQDLVEAEAGQPIDEAKIHFEDVRDESSGLPPDKGYKLLSGVFTSAKYDCDEPPSDTDFLGTDPFPNADPVGPLGPVKLLHRSKEQAKEPDLFPPTGEEGVVEPGPAPVDIETSQRFVPPPMTDEERLVQKNLQELEDRRQLAGNRVSTTVVKPMKREDQEAHFFFHSKKARLERCPYKADDPVWLLLNEGEPRDYLGDRQNVALMGLFRLGGRCISANGCLLRNASQYSRLHVQLVHSGFANYVYSNPVPDDVDEREGRPESDWDGYFQLTLVIRPATKDDY